MSTHERITVLHVDLDAFYASVEQRDNPELRGQPVVVGATEGRGVVAAASYEARRFGIRSAMSMAEARRRCPTLIACPPRFSAYREASELVHEVFESVTPNIEPIALDEAFLEIAGAVRSDAEIPELAMRIRRAIRTTTELPASIGAGTTKLIAKLASEAAKPDGVRIVEVGAELEFLAPLPVERLWGVGPATLTKLHDLGIGTVAQLRRLPTGALDGALGANLGAHLLALACNDDDRPVVPDRSAKSIGHEVTLPRDAFAMRDAQRIVSDLGDQVARRLRASETSARTVQLKVRFGDFETITRSTTFSFPVDGRAPIVDAAQRLLREVAVERGIRLLGVSVSQLAPTAVQETLALTSDARAVDDALVDSIRARFGPHALRRASDLSGLTDAALEQDPLVRENKRTPSDEGDGSAAF
ncbi:MAG: DNA polymerase IV [Acidimicrobiia bacterium]